MIRLKYRRIAAGALAAAAAFSLGAAPLAGAATAKLTAKSSTSSVEKALQALEVPPTASETITEKGSSLFYPLFQLWQSGYPHSNISIQPSAGGSGAGVSGALGGTTNIGASDPYLPPIDLTEGVVNVPVVVSAQTVDYNIPGLKAGVHLHISPLVLNEIYAGTITMWNASQIKTLNKGVNIPAIPIVTLHRSDSSGDTFLFTSYIDFGNGGTTANPAQGTSFVAGLGGPQNILTWPSAPGALAENGNSGMLTACEATTGCIAYIGISYLNNALAAHLGYALLENHAGQYVGPTKANILTEVASYKNIPANGVLSMIDSAAKSAKTGYPIVNFEYAIVKTSQSDSNVAQAIKAVLAWGMDTKGGSAPSFLAQVQFQPLPANALAVAVNILKQIS